MAEVINGSFTTDECVDRSLTFSWTLESQSIANNTSTISWKLKGSGSAYGYVSGGGFYLKIDNIVKLNQSTDTRKDLYQDTVAASGTITILHNTDGTKTFSAELEAAIYYFARNVSGSGTWTLPTIPVSSNLSTGALTMGTESIISISKANDTFTNTISYAWGDTSDSGIVNGKGYKGTIVSKTSDDSVSWTPPIEFANIIPNSTYGTGTLTCDTYNGNNKVGTSSIKFTCNVPETMVPIMGDVTAQIINDNSTLSDWDVAVAGYSKVKITASASGSHSSTIKEYVISNGYTQTSFGTSLTYTGEIINTSGDKIFNVKCMDSRNRYSEAVASNTVAFYEYTTPFISSFSVKRDTNNSSKIIVKSAWTISSINDYNTSTAVLSYKIANTSAWTTYGEISNNESITLDDEFTETRSYRFRLLVTDALGNSDQEEAFISTVTVLMDFRAGGKGLGIGKIAESNSLEVAFPAKFYHSINLNGINLGVSQVLWEGASQMTNSTEDTVILSNRITSQPTGIILAFSRVTDTEVNNYGFNLFFVPKYQVETFSGNGTFFLLGNNMDFNVIGGKYLYISNTEINGNANNSSSGTGGCGITYDNSAFVLRYVLGV